MVLTIGLERLDPANAVGDLARTLLARAACLEPPGVTFPRDLLSRTAPIASDNPEHLRRADQALNLLITSASSTRRPAGACACTG